MTITLIRHARVTYDFKKYSRYFEFDKSCIEYDNSPICREIESRITSSANIIYVSSLKRTHDTSRLIFPDKVPIENKLFDEVPINFAPLPFLVPTVLWFGIGRLQWFFGIQKQSESKQDTKNRVRKAVDILEANNQDVTLISHGLFMRLLVKELKRRDFLLEGEATYKNLDCIRFRML